MSDRVCEVVYGNRRIAFTLRHADRSTLAISVLPDGTVDVVAPLGTVFEDVQARVARRARWILGQQRYFEQFRPRTPERQYVSGETHLYLGRQYRLKVVGGERESVKLVGGRFLVVVREPSDLDHIQEVLERWYREKARERFAERLRWCWERLDRSDAVPPELRIRAMRTRWGSLSPSGTLSLSPDLTKAPRDCIDYVILHELCHLEHPNHGPAFRARLEQVLPDWERQKHRLELTLA